MKSLRFIFIVLILALASLACFSAGSPTPSSNILFSDDFSNTAKKWDQVTESKDWSLIVDYSYHSPA